MEEKYLLGRYDLIVVGAGHAGCEAALAGSRMGKKTLLLSINLEAVAMLACNPSIGGTGKGHLVKEIDALGGEMGKNIDKSFIQMKMLNTSKGPAVHSLRAQADKNQYQREMKKTLEQEENLFLKQGEVIRLILENKQIQGVEMISGGYYLGKAVILATGTFLGGKIYIGDKTMAGGPNGLAPSLKLAENLREIGLPMRKFKTGTPARALGKSLCYPAMARQDGDEKMVPFSFLNDQLQGQQIPCWLTYTNETTHRIIEANFHRSALFGGHIEGVGPRYCPSIEDKIHRFADKERHQLFVEPEGRDTDEVYLQGMSTSLSEDIQEKFYRTIPGLENLEIVRYGYAIEYDCIDPQRLKSSLESKDIENLFCAGQFNGSSGYEEAAAQGLMAGINAVKKLNGENPLVLKRNEAYIGVLIDDLTLKGTNEPYRIMTSRAEYRLVLRQDNADLRLTKIGYQVGLASEERYKKLLEKEKILGEVMEALEETRVSPAQVRTLFQEKGIPEPKKKLSLKELLRRSEIQYRDVQDFLKEKKTLSETIVTQIEVQIKYRGYIDKQLGQIEKFKKWEKKKLPESLCYKDIHGLRIEARQKLDEIRPDSIGKASRISGVSPADINVLLIYLEKMRRKQQ